MLRARVKLGLIREKNSDLNRLIRESSVSLQTIVPDGNRVVGQFEILAVEAPGFSPAKKWAVDGGFSRGKPQLKPGSVVALSARLKPCPSTGKISS